MGNRATPWVPVLALLLLMLLQVFCFAVAAAVAGDVDIGFPEEEAGRDIFLLQESKRVVKTKAGEMRVVKSYGGRIVEKPLHIGFITMEPRSLFIPQYLDSSLILFIHSGEAKIGTTYKDELVEKKLKMGDLYRIPAGNTFYLVNTGEGQRLHIICSIDPSESLGMGGAFQSFFIGGGNNPVSVLAGFGLETLSAALNVSIAEVKEMTTRLDEGPIVSIDSEQEFFWSEILKLKQQDRFKQLKKMLVLIERDLNQPSTASEFTKQKRQYRLRQLWSVLAQIEEERYQRGERSWWWMKLFKHIISPREENSKKSVDEPESYNLYERRPDFKNDYGWSIALDESDYTPLKKSGIGIYFVNLTAGSMMAPHVNPTATEYGIVLRGTGTIQVVFPNGTGTTARVKRGDVFWVPKYFPFCQIASRGGPLEFFGFTTSAHKNHPQFLIGANSLLDVMRGPEMAAAFGMSEKKFELVAAAQTEAVIVPSRYAEPPGTEEEVDEEMTRIERVIKGFGTGRLNEN